MPQVEVMLPGRPTHYVIEIADGLFDRLGERVAQAVRPGQKLLIISDVPVARLYLESARTQLTQAGFEVYTYTVAGGEASKSLGVWQEVMAFALDIGLSRKDAFIALGGGVVGDLTGFCAATYFRGVPFIQVPTTLLAQVDSSVGGKVGLNFHTAKNGVGAFYQPRMVLADARMLTTLPHKEVLAGMAEVVKYGLIETTCTQQPPTLLSHLERLAETDGLNGVMAALPEIITRCCAIKAAVVEQDETEETGLRSVLNLGHTFAHAYEEITYYERWLHGEAVALGMIQALRLSVQRGLLPQSDLDRVLALYACLGLSTQLPEEFEPMALLRLMRRDKKSTQGKITLVLPQAPLGTVILTDAVEETQLLALL
jgi:3-dehydroquinate synthase